MEEDYYKLLNINYDASITDINKTIQYELKHFKFLPFLTNEQQKKIKLLKKAKFIFNNSVYKEIYDQNILKNLDKKNNLPDYNTYLSNRIFEIKINDLEILNNDHWKNDEYLKPKNTGLIADKDININETDMFNN
jgi:hypothetical protein